MTKQEEVNLAVKQARAEWDGLVKASGKSETVFIATSREAAQFIGEYAQFQEGIRRIGLDMPDLIEGLKVSFE